MLRRYCAPISISSGSGVNTRIISRGAQSAASANSSEASSEKRRAMPSTTSMARISFLP